VSCLLIKSILETMQKERTVVSYNKLFQYLSGVTEKNRENLSENERSSGYISKAGPPEFKAAILATRSRRLITSFQYGMAEETGNYELPTRRAGEAGATDGVTSVSRPQSLDNRQ
jgi:hypothetical protein